MNESWRGRRKGRVREKHYKGGEREGRKKHAGVTKKTGREQEKHEETGEETKEEQRIRKNNTRRKTRNRKKRESEEEGINVVGNEV